ncbi:molybdopterin-dependent oxidoreductase [Sulfitobacter sp. S0837]|uniref:molybdopterin-dependent oxidoreductase n=1 Tax=Sulfitobacter maritimus TaxID=2741719 RepID=UPI001581B815|nr:molybdopterin-dependent oxidoreductase [Sulfitobacter maritimus]NUH66341.1 molybdopterin-dependent oxidoreductase [Sulfitobacter maritimus]NUH66345.1 molybdopterin-dependent oxidoreductase [Sulfitobacter maritimus]NUH66352.1 molybdopterin-dependent oxidoreductase [Sulfitobacter maritimus]
MRYAAISISTCIALAGAALAAEEPVILKVTGLIDDAPAHFTMADLRALPTTTLETSTVVTDGVHNFTGVLLRDLLAQLDATGDVITATALNDYVVDIPRADVEQYDVIVGYSMNGAELDRADKGPLWIVYPRDGHEALQDIRYDYRWVWQLSELEIR